MANQFKFKSSVHTGTTVMMDKAFQQRVVELEEN